MAKKNRTELKAYFETGKRPTQSDFGNLIDSLVLIEETPKKNYKLFTCLFSSLIGRGNIPYTTTTVLENSLEEEELNISIVANRISIESGRNAFNLDRIFVLVGLLNEECGFDIVRLSLEESTDRELIMYCESIIRDEPIDPNDPVINPPQIPLFPITFSNLPIEIRVYN